MTLSATIQVSVIVATTATAYDLGAFAAHAVDRSLTTASATTCGTASVSGPVLRAAIVASW